MGTPWRFIAGKIIHKWRIFQQATIDDTGWYIESYFQSQEIRQGKSKGSSDLIFFSWFNHQNCWLFGFMLEFEALLFSGLNSCQWTGLKVQETLHFMEHLWFPVDFPLNQSMDHVHFPFPLVFWRPSTTSFAFAKPPFEVFLGVSVWFAVVNHKARLFLFGGRMGQEMLGQVTNGPDIYGIW